MSNRFSGRGLELASIEVDKLAPSAIQNILASKIVALRTVVTAFSFPAAESSVVTTQVLSVAAVVVPQVTLTVKGLYTGAIFGANDSKLVELREEGSDNPITYAFFDDA